MRAILNERGVTLIEVLAAMAILSIILISLMNIFPQMGLINKQNEDKAQAVNSAKYHLNLWKTKTEIPSNYINTDDKFYYYEDTDPELGNDVVIKIKKQTDSTNINAHQIHIQIKNERDTVLSETYGYMIVK